MGNDLDILLNNKAVIIEFLKDRAISLLGFRYLNYSPRSVYLMYKYPNSQTHKIRIQTNGFFRELGLKTDKNAIQFAFPNEILDKRVAFDVVKEFKDFAEADFEELGEENYRGIEKDEEYVLDYSNPVYQGGLIILGKYSTDNACKVILNALNHLFQNFDEEKYLKLKEILYKKLEKES